MAKSIKVSDEAYQNMIKFKEMGIPITVQIDVLYGVKPSINFKKREEIQDGRSDR